MYRWRETFTTTELARGGTDLGERMRSPSLRAIACGLIFSCIAILATDWWNQWRLVVSALITGPAVGWLGFKLLLKACPRPVWVAPIGTLLVPAWAFVFGGGMEFVISTIAPADHREPPFSFASCANQGYFFARVSITFPFVLFFASLLFLMLTWVVAEIHDGKTNRPSKRRG